MNEESEIPENVLGYLAKCSGIVGRFHDDIFNQDTWLFIKENGIASPIEQLLYCALSTAQKLSFIPDLNPKIDGDQLFMYGLYISPQVEIGKYRVDFVVQYNEPHRMRPSETKPSEKVQEVIVECDSQEWHERTEKERRYEKARDRYFTVKGYKVFHFTGKEITDDPFKVACEVISYVTGQPVDELFDSKAKYE